MDFWTVETFAANYQLTDVPDTALNECLMEAQAQIQAYMTDESYASAVVEESPYYLVKRVMGELAAWIWYRRPNASAPATLLESESKSYGGDLKKFNRTYRARTSINLVVEQSATTILAQLVDYHRPSVTPGDMTTWWGTGRVFT